MSAQTEYIMRKSLRSFDRIYILPTNLSGNALKLDVSQPASTASVKLSQNVRPAIEQSLHSTWYHVQHLLRERLNRVLQRSHTDSTSFPTQHGPFIVLCPWLRTRCSKNKTLRRRRCEHRSRALRSATMLSSGVFGIEAGSWIGQKL